MAARATLPSIAIARRCVGRAGEGQRRPPGPGSPIIEGDDTCRSVGSSSSEPGTERGRQERPIRTFDVAPTVARMLGFKMPECEGQPLRELV